MGCGWRDFGKDWIHIDSGDYEHLDYCSITDLSQFEDDSIDLVYASHVIEYFDREQVVSILDEWYRILKPGAEIRIAVPDFEQMSKLYVDNSTELSDILGPLYGKMSMGNEIIYHRTVYDFKTLEKTLNFSGFEDIERYDWGDYKDHVENDDHSQSYLCPKGDKKNGVLISLNVVATK